MKRIIALVLCFILCAALVGCTQNTEKTTDTDTQPVTAPETETTKDTAVPEKKMSYEDYVGGWFVNETKEDCLNVKKCDENEIEFEASIFRTFGFSDTAAFSDGAYRFGDGVSEGYKGPEGVSGTVELKDGGILVTYESFGKFEDASAWGNEYYFTVRDAAE